MKYNSTRLVSGTGSSRGRPGEGKGGRHTRSRCADRSQQRAEESGKVAGLNSLTLSEVVFFNIALGNMSDWRSCLVWSLFVNGRCQQFIHEGKNVCTVGHHHVFWAHFFFFFLQNKTTSDYRIMIHMIWPAHKHARTYKISGCVQLGTILSLFLGPGLEPGEDEHQQSAAWWSRTGR